MKRARARVGGFTLVEVILALLIFSFLVGAIFMSVSAVTNASAMLGDEQMRARKIDAFVRWVRSGFLNLSAASRIEIRTRDTGAAGLAIDLLIRDAPGCFPLGQFDAMGSDVILSTIPDGRGGAEFSLARLPSGLEEAEFDRAVEDAVWFPVMEGIRTLRWGFLNPATGEFEETWDRPEETPDIINLAITLATGEVVDSYFYLPRLAESSAGFGGGRPSPPGPDEPGPDPDPNPDPEEVP